MKKIILVALIITLLLSTLAGCSSTPIEQARDQAVEIGRNYLEYKITADEAIQRLNSIVVPQTEKGVATILLQGDIAALTLELTFIKSSSSSADYNAVKEKIDSMEDKDYEKWEEPPFYSE